MPLAPGLPANGRNKVEVRKGRRMRKVTAAIMEENGKVFIAKRKGGRHLSGKWEFPGGKMENGETPEEALRRELDEELGIVVEVGELLCSVRFTVGSAEYELLAFRATRVSGEPILREHEDARWVAPSGLFSYDLANSDRKVAESVFGQGTGGGGSNRSP